MIKLDQPWSIIIAQVCFQCRGRTRVGSVRDLLIAELMTEGRWLPIGLLRKRILREESIGKSPGKKHSIYAYFRGNSWANIMSFDSLAGSPILASETDGGASTIFLGSKSKVGSFFVDFGYFLGVFFFFKCWHPRQFTPWVHPLW